MRFEFLKKKTQIDNVNMSYDLNILKYDFGKKKTTTTSSVEIYKRIK